MFQPPLGRCWNTWKTWALSKTSAICSGDRTTALKLRVKRSRRMCVGRSAGGNVKVDVTPLSGAKTVGQLTTEKKWTKIQLVIKQKKGILGKRGQQSTRKAPDCLNGTHSAVMCRWTLPLIVPDTLAGCFPPMLDTNRAQNEKEPPPATRHLAVSSPPRAGALTETCAHSWEAVWISGWAASFISAWDGREGERERGRYCLPSLPPK